MFERHLAPHLAQRASTMPVVTLIGPRQSGKTTLVRHVFPDCDYLSLERPDVRTHARADPLDLLAGHPKGLILDEVHRVPELLSYIQVSVDEDDRPGRFVLTGSQNFLLMEKVSQSLAGRTAILRLLPLSLAELHGWGWMDPDGLDRPPEVRTPPAEAPWAAVWAGFYPRIHDRQLEPDVWLADYQRTYVERDVRDVLRIMDLDAFERFIRLAAARTGQELNLASLAEDVGITQPTARAWMTALRVGSLVALLPPHHENFRKRLRKRPKLHFLDTGLACYLLGIRSPQVLARHPLRGPLFESFVVAELTKAFEHAGREAPLYFWKDRTGHEVDVLLDLGDRLVPVEVKSARTVAADALAGLQWWTRLAAERASGGALVYGGAAAMMRQGFAVRPWSLW